MSDQQAEHAAPATPPTLVWEGPLFATSSLAIVNRELCLRLLDRGAELALETLEPVPDELDARGPRAGFVHALPPRTLR